MNCPNCGQTYPEDALLCPHCGAPLPRATPPAPGPGLPAQPAGTPSLPGSSGMATASLVLGLLSIVLSASTYVVWVFMLAPYLSSTGAIPSAEELQSLFNPAAILGIAALLVLGQLLAVLGLILGIAGVSQERRRPTRSGKALGIVGIASSIIPLLCCVTLVLLGLSRAGGVQ